MKRNFYDLDQTLINQRVLGMSGFRPIFEPIEESKPLPAFYRMKSQYDNGEPVYILTARPEYEKGRQEIQSFLRKNGIHIPDSHIHMTGSVGLSKAGVIMQYFDSSDEIEFHDDHPLNIETVIHYAEIEGFDNLHTFLIPSNYF